MRRTVALNEGDRRIGEDHQMAKLTDAEVELIRDLNDHGLGYKRLAVKFDVSPSCIARICRFETRSHVAVKWKSIWI
jgi:hypothetical protein